jgi:hypothetical protein
MEVDSFLKAPVGNIYPIEISTVVKEHGRLSGGCCGLGEHVHFLDYILAGLGALL